MDPRPQTVDGEIKIVITPQLKLDIFEEYPVVKRAFEENVDKKVCAKRLRPFQCLDIFFVSAQLSEPEFWHRYFQSKLFNAHRASIRSSAAQHVVRDDPIFDKYLEKDDDGTTAQTLRLTLADTAMQSWSHGDCGKIKWTSLLTSVRRKKTMSRYSPLFPVLTPIG